MLKKKTFYLAISRGLINVCRVSGGLINVHRASGGGGGGGGGGFINVCRVQNVCRASRGDSKVFVGCLGD